MRDEVWVGPERSLTHLGTPAEGALLTFKAQEIAHWEHREHNTLS